MNIKLSDKQCKYALKLAMNRHNAKDISFRNTNIDNFHNQAKEDLSAQFKVDYQYMPHFIGVVGELAWSLFTGEKIDENIYPVRDNGYDFKNVEVKTITYNGPGEPELKIPVAEYEKRTPPACYVLTKLDFNKMEVSILGTITRENFDSLKKRKRYGDYKPYNYVVPLCVMDVF